MVMYKIDRRGRGLGGSKNRSLGQTRWSATFDWQLIEVLCLLFIHLNFLFAALIVNNEIHDFYVPQFLFKRLLPILGKYWSKSWIVEIIFFCFKLTYFQTSKFFCHLKTLTLLFWPENGRRRKWVLETAGRWTMCAQVLESTSFRLWGSEKAIRSG